MVSEATSAEPVSLPERGAPGGFPAKNLPIVLPGESLSKYGGRPETKSSPAPALSRSASPSGSFAKPSTLVDVPTGWDGGSVLPGETLSRHRRSQSSAGYSQAAAVAEAPLAESRLATAEEPIRVHDPEPEVGHLEIEAEHFETPKPVETHAAPAPAVAAAPVIVPEPEAAAKRPVFETIEETTEEVHEYEPEEASASHRVESPRSEFRFASVEEEEEETAEEQAKETEASSGHELQSTAGPVLPQAEMPTTGTQAEATSPESEVIRQLFGYAPGMGVLEEETIDEDEYDFEPIPGQPEEHLTEEMEEETLDQASTVGDALRDVHLEQRLGYGSPAEADEDEGTDEAETGFAETDEEEFEEAEGGEEESEEPPVENSGETPASAGAPVRREDRRFGRRGGRGGRQPGRRQGGRRPNMQTSSLPIISELLKQGQEILVQIAKEPIARKGARITSHIALPGRFLVFMPTVNHVGVSRKIASDEERQRLKRVLASEKGTASGGFIVRTAAESASEDDLRADIRFLINLWNEIKQRSDDAKRRR